MDPGPYRPCRILRVEPDGRPRFRDDAGEAAAKIHGLEVASPPPGLYREILEQRLAERGEGLQCRRRRPPESGEERVQFQVLEWQDKSGDVWRDLALVLLDQGVARVAEGAFPERGEYLGAERGRRRPANG